MTLKNDSKLGNLIHVARIFINGRWNYLFLRKNESESFTWHEEVTPNHEVEASVSAPTIEEAMRLAAKHWNTHSFHPLACGFRYTLPERDEHGINALFHQMAASYHVGNGIYYDEELGNNCFVQNASEESLKLWRQLIVENRM